MKNVQSILSILGVAFATWTTAGLATAETIPTQKVSRQESTSATVEKVDTAKRELSLRDAQGQKFMVQVPENVTRFDAIKKGDQIQVDYYESAALSLKKPGEASRAGEATMAQRTAGNLPGGVVARRITASVEVMKVDRENNTVTIRGPKGEIDTVKVTDPNVQADLAKLNVGDRIQATYNEAIAISVTPKEKETR